MTKQTEATSIPIFVKEKVAERDSIDGYPCCLRCGVPAPYYNRLAFSNAHFIARSHGGLGIEENIVTLCPACHRIYDTTHERSSMREMLKNYLQSKYDYWDERDLVYRKEK